MKKYLIVIALLVSPITYGNEVSILNGKGVQHNPNSDNVAITLRMSERDYGNFKTYTEFGIGSTNSMNRTYGRPYTMLGAGKQIEVTKGMFFASASLGLALAQRTSDGPEITVSPYGSAFVGVRHNGFSAAFGQWILYKPSLHYRWSVDGVEEHERWNSPVFTGFRIGIDLEVKRSNK